MPSTRFWRRLHLWVGLLTAVPMVVLAVSGALWLHRDVLGLHPAKIEQPKATAERGPHGPALPLDSDDWRVHAGAIDEAIAEARRRWKRAAKLDRIELKHQPGHGVIVKIRAAKGERVAPHEVVYSTVERDVVSLGGGPHWVERLHKGDLLFGPRWAFLWLDLSAAGMLIVVISGLWIWRVRPRARSTGASREAAAATPASSSDAAGGNQ